MRQQPGLIVELAAFDQPIDLLQADQIGIFSFDAIDHPLQRVAPIAAADALMDIPAEEPHRLATRGASAQKITLHSGRAGAAVGTARGTLGPRQPRPPHRFPHPRRHPLGNVEIDKQALVTIKGGSGTTFGTLTGGAITVGAGDILLAYTDGIFLGIDLPLRTSGDHDGTAGCILVGPAGAITIRRGVIRAERHVHMHPDDAAHFGVKDADYMKLKIDGPCGVTFDRVKVRVNKKVKLEVHIDTDEGNACNLSTATRMELLK